MKAFPDGTTTRNIVIEPLSKFSVNSHARACPKVIRVLKRLLCKSRPNSDQHDCYNTKNALCFKTNQEYAAETASAVGTAALTATLNLLKDDAKSVHCAADLLKRASSHIFRYGAAV